MYKIAKVLLSVKPKAHSISRSVSGWTVSAAATKLGQQDIKREVGKFNNWTCKRKLYQQTWKAVSDRNFGWPKVFKLGNSCCFSSSDKTSGTKLKKRKQEKMIIYERITPNDYAEVAEHMLKGFYVNEPFGLALGLTLKEVESWFPKFLKDVLNYYEPVSFMAKDSETNEIVGAIINVITDEKRESPPSMKAFLNKEEQPVKWQIVQFLEDLEEGVDPVQLMNMDKSKENKILVCLFVSVLPTYGGKGIATTLTRESERSVKKLLEGVTIAMTDVTSQFSYLIFKKMGYDMVKEVEYMSYKDPNGIPIFEGREKLLGIHTHARVMVKKM